MRRLAAAILAVPAVLAAQPAAAKLHRTVTVLPGQPPVTFRSEGVAVTFAAPSQAELDASEDGPPPPVRVTVTFPGMAPFTVPPEEQRLDMHGITVGIGALAKRDQPVVTLEGYSGGMHCCATFQMVVPTPGRPQVVSLPGMDGVPSRAFARDLDGDGAAEIERADDRFLYAFTSYAASWAPPLYYNLQAGALADVSSEPRYARLFAAYAQRARKACARKAAGRNGACAAHAAAMARLGKAEEGVAFAVAQAENGDWLPEPCTVPLSEDGECPEGKALQFSGFEEALRWFLKDAGYTA